jgi:hypothetical protein
MEPPETDLRSVQLVRGIPGDGNIGRFGSGFSTTWWGRLSIYVFDWSKKTWMPSFAGKTGGHCRRAEAGAGRDRDNARHPRRRQVGRDAEGVGLTVDRQRNHGGSLGLDVGAARAVPRKFRAVMAG